MNFIQQVAQGLRTILQWWVVVAPWEKGIRVRRGKDMAVLDPGIHLRIPLLDRVYVHAVRLRISDASNQTMSTKDGKSLTLSVAIEWSIGDIKKLYDSISLPESTLMQRVQALVAEYVVTRNAAELSPAALSVDVSKQLQQTDWGFAGLAIRCTAFAFCRTYRLIAHDYRSLTGLDLEREVTKVVQ